MGHFSICMLKDTGMLGMSSLHSCATNMWQIKKIMFIISIAKEFRKVQSFACKHAHLCAPFTCLIPSSDQLFIVPPAFKIISAPICKLVKPNARAHILDRNETLMSAFFVQSVFYEQSRG